MDRVGSAIIDFTEAAYDLELDDEAWLPSILNRGLPVLDQGLGVICMDYRLPPHGAAVELRGVHVVGSGPPDFAERHLRALESTPPEVLREQFRPGGAGTASAECGQDPKQLAHYTSHVNHCKDLLYITAADERGVGVAIVAPLAEVTSLTPHESERWQMLAAHLEAGHRLRCGLAAKDAGDERGTELPRHAEAIFDANSFRITDAVGSARESAAAKKLREAAIAVDRARGKLRRSNPEKALEIWKALVRGRWSTVDWFDSDGRRFVLAIPNSPDVTDPRGLSERERQVVRYAAFGQTNKMIAYRLGLSRSRISLLLRSAMRKLGAKTRAQLVQMVQTLDALE